MSLARGLRLKSATIPVKEIPREGDPRGGVGGYHYKDLQTKQMTSH
jgi:hypothetical protein